MLPITRATADNFCRGCLHILDKDCQVKKVLSYNLKHDLQLLRILNLLSVGTQTKGEILGIPNTLCHCCYTKMSVFRKFAEMSVCSNIAIRELTAEKHALTKSDKFKDICATCFKIKSSNFKASHSINDVELDDLLQIMFVGLHKPDKLEPQSICKHCSQKFKAFIEFQKLLRESQQYFVSILSNSDDLAETQSAIQLKENITKAEQPIEVQDENNLFSPKEAFDPTPRHHSQHEMQYNCETLEDESRLSSSEEHDCYNDSELEIYNITQPTKSVNDDPIKLCDPKPKIIGTDITRPTHNETFLSCETCSRTFRKISTYEAHKCKRNPIIKTATKSVVKNTKTDSTFNLIKKIDTEPAICTICLKDFRTETRLKAHTDRVHCKPLFKCHYCMREFKRKSHLTDHVKMVHEGLRPFKCGYCVRTFGLARTLRIHEMGHTNERPFECNNCEKTFRTRNELNVHIKNHFGASQFRCPICSHLRSSQEELDLHISRHQNKDGFQCCKCGRKFKKQCHLKEHDDAVHLKLRPYKCSHVGCGKSFAARKTVQIHERTHQAICVFNCDMCTEQFSTKRQLERHIRIHKETVTKKDKRETRKIINTF